MIEHTPRTVLDFWFSDEYRPFWFSPSKAFDRRVQEHLGNLYEQAVAERLETWRETPEGALALVILLDQVPRNLFRNTSKAFATDARALAVAQQAAEQGFDHDMTSDQRLFLYLPFEHSENLQDQEKSVQLMAERIGPGEYLNYAERHRDIIQRFGRFPHRNAALDRTSTPEEMAFLQEPGSAF